MNFIEELQNKPRFIRIQILWISVILVMSIIIFIWLVLLKSSLEFSEIEQGSLEKQQSVPSLFGTIKEDFSILKKSLQAGVKEIIGSSQKPEFEVEIIK